jgi:hypothetical protein
MATLKQAGIKVVFTVGEMLEPLLVAEESARSCVTNRFP